MCNPCHVLHITDPQKQLGGISCAELPRLSVGFQGGSAPPRPEPARRVSARPGSGPADVSPALAIHECMVCGESIHKALFDRALINALTTKRSLRQSLLDDQDVSGDN